MKKYYQNEFSLSGLQKFKSYGIAKQDHLLNI